MANDINTYSQFPNLDQLSKEERGMFVKEHEFEASLNTMISELNSLLNTTGGNSSEIQNQKARVSEALNTLVGNIESTLHDLIKRYLLLIADETNKVRAAEERIYAKIHNVIQSINANIQNRTITYDAVMGYKLRIMNAAYESFGPVSPYNDNRKKDPAYSIQKNTVAFLRDIDEGVRYRCCSLNLDPSIKQGEIIKICSWDPIDNSTPVPAFLAELMISGDLYAFKGIVSSTNKNPNGDRTVVFDADYFINQDLPFSIKTFYDSTNKKIVLALVYDTTDDNFTSIIKLDIGVNLLVGNNLKFAPNCTKMSNVGLLTYNVNVTAENLEVLDTSNKMLISQYTDKNEYIGTVKKQIYRVQTGSSINIVFSVPKTKTNNYSLPNIYNSDYTNKLSVLVNGIERKIYNDSTGDTHFYLSSGLLNIENIDGDVTIIVKAVQIPTE